MDEEIEVASTVPAVLLVVEVDPEPSASPAIEHVKRSRFRIAWNRHEQQDGGWKFDPTHRLTHWDNFTAPYGASQQPAIDAVQSFAQEVTAASPNSKVIVPKYFEPISLDLPSR